MTRPKWTPPKRKRYVTVEVDVGPADLKHGAVGWEASGMWLWCLCYSAARRLDGFVPHGALVAMFGSQYQRARPFKNLLGAGLFEPHPDGIMLHDYADYQMLARDEDARARAAREKGKKGVLARRGLVEPPPPPSAPRTAESSRFQTATGQPTGTSESGLESGHELRLKGPPYPNGQDPTQSPGLSHPLFAVPEPLDPAEPSQNAVENVNTDDSYGSTHGTTHGSSYGSTRGSPETNPRDKQKLKREDKPLPPNPHDTEPPASPPPNGSSPELLAAAARALLRFEHHRNSGPIPDHDRRRWITRIATVLQQTNTAHATPREFDRITAAAFAEKWWTHRNPNTTPDPGALYGSAEIWMRRVEYAGGIKPPRRTPTPEEAAYLAAW